VLRYASHCVPIVSEIWVTSNWGNRPFKLCNIIALNRIQNNAVGDDLWVLGIL